MHSWVRWPREVLAKPFHSNPEPVAAAGGGRRESGPHACCFTTGGQADSRERAPRSVVGLAIDAFDALCPSGAYYELFVFPPVQPPCRRRVKDDGDLRSLTLLPFESRSTLPGHSRNHTGPPPLASGSSPPPRTLSNHRPSLRISFLRSCFFRTECKERSCFFPKLFFFEQSCRSYYSFFPPRFFAAQVVFATERAWCREKKPAFGKLVLLARASG